MDSGKTGRRGSRGGRVGYDRGGGAPFPVVRIFADGTGTTHFEDGCIELEPAGAIGSLSDAIPGGRVFFRRTDDDYDYDWHPTPARQFIILLNGEIEIETGDGEMRRIAGGEVLFLEDTTAPGHRTKNVGETPRWSVFIQTDAPVPYVPLRNSRSGCGGGARLLHAVDERAGADGRDVRGVAGARGDGGGALRRRGFWPETGAAVASGQ